MALSALIALSVALRGRPVRRERFFLGGSAPVPAVAAVPAAPRCAPPPLADAPPLA